MSNSSTNRNQIAEAFDISTASRLNSPTLNKLWSDAFGSSYPAEVLPNAFYPSEVLQTLENVIGRSEGETLVDLGCGHGLTGLQLALQLDMLLTGIDISPASISLATRHAAVAGMQNRARFMIRDIVDTGLVSAGCGAVISLDVLLYASDKDAAVSEVARILRPGGYFGFTTWEQEGHSDRLGSTQISDSKSFLEQRDFKIIHFEEPQDWRRQQAVVLEGAIAHQEDLRREIGNDASTLFVNMAKGALKEMPSRRYIFCIGQRL